MKKSIIFDMDGVLVDNRDIHIEAFAQFCKGKNVPFSNNSLDTLFGMTNNDIMPVIMGRTLSDSEIELYAHEKEIIYREIFEQKIEPAKGLITYLKALKAAGFTIAVGSSGPLSNVRFVLERCGIAEYFDAIVHGEMVANGKPNPDIFLKAAELLNSKPSECVVIEDAHVGIEAAKRAGMKVVAITTTYRAEQLTNYDLLIASFDELTIEKTESLLK